MEESDPSRVCQCGKPALDPRINWCLAEECFHRLVLSGLGFLIRRQDESQKEEVIRLQSVIRRLLAGAKDVRFWLQYQNEAQVIEPRPGAALASLEKAVKECGLEIPE